MEQRRKTLAFTLAELLIVITIMGILMSMISMGIVSARHHAMRTRADAQLRDLTKAWMQYYMVYGSWPAFPDSSPTGGGNTAPPSPSLSVGSGSVTWVPMTYNNMQPLMVTIGNTISQNYNSKQIPFISMRLDGGDYQDPWHNTYWVAFPTASAMSSPTQTTNVAMHVSVMIPNFNRYRNN